MSGSGAERPSRIHFCGMNVDEQNSTIQVDFESRTFHFCSEECKEVFQTNPGPYANAVG